MRGQAYAVPVTHGAWSSQDVSTIWQLMWGSIGIIDHAKMHRGFAYKISKHSAHAAHMNPPQQSNEICQRACSICVHGIENNSGIQPQWRYHDLIPYVAWQNSSSIRAHHIGNTWQHSAHMRSHHNPIDYGRKQGILSHITSTDVHVAVDNMVR